VERDRTERPGDQQPERSQHESTAEALEDAGAAVADEPLAEDDADSLHRDRERRPEEHAAQQGDERRVGRFGAVGEQRRPEAAADRRPADEPDERQDAANEAPLPADRGERQGEDRDQDVDD